MVSDYQQDAGVSSLTAPMWSLGEIYISYMIYWIIFYHDIIGAAKILYIVNITRFYK